MTYGFRIPPGYRGLVEVAKEVGVTTRTLLKWERAGHIPKPGRLPDNRRVYSKEGVAAIVAYINSPRVRPPEKSESTEPTPYAPFGT